LADDLHRFLHGRPIQARPVSAPERLWRWCRRQPLVAGLVGLLFLVVDVGFTTVIQLWLRAEDATKRAEENLDEARRAVRQHFTLLSEEELDREPGRQGQQKQRLEAALGYFQQFLQKRPDDPALQTDVADACFRAGLITSKIGSKEDALAHLQEA